MDLTSCTHIAKISERSLLSRMAGMSRPVLQSQIKQVKTSNVNISESTSEPQVHA